MSRLPHSGGPKAEPGTESEGSAERVGVRLGLGLGSLGEVLHVRVEASGLTFLTSESPLLQSGRVLRRGDEDEANSDRMASLARNVLNSLGDAQQSARLAGSIASSCTVTQIEGIEDAVKEGYDLSYMRDTLARILGPDHPHLDVLADITQAVPLYRAAFTPETLDNNTMTEEIVSLIEALAASTTKRGSV